MNKVLLTGAGGFIGSHIAELFSEQGIPLRCLIRRSGKSEFLEQLHTEIYYGDITQKESIKDALTGVDFVIHTAGKSSDWGCWEDFYLCNVVGTMNILEACREAGITDVIITGSVSSYGEEDSMETKNEDSSGNSHYPYFLDRLFPSAMNYYRDSKAILTQRANVFATQNEMNVTILEPAWVYGEREFNTGFYAYLKAVQDGMSYAPGCKTNMFHVIYARDLAEAYLRAYHAGLKGVNRIIVGNPTPQKLTEIYRQLCSAADLALPHLLPKWLVYPVGFVMEILATLIRKKEPPLLTRSRVNMMYDSIMFSSAKAKLLLDFEAKTALAEGISRTVRWYKQNGYLKE